MPITNCEASKATPGKGIAYILDPAKVIARGSQGLMSDNPEKIAKQMMQTMHFFGKGYERDERKYYHAKIAFDPTDRPENGGTLSAQKANGYAAQYAAAIWPEREVVWAVQDHGTSIHIHFVVAACQCRTGEKLDARNKEYRQWKDYANTLAVEYGLSSLDWRKATAEKRQREKCSGDVVKSTFTETNRRENGKSVWKDELRAVIDRAVAKCCSMEEFGKFLAENGVALTRNSESIISYKKGSHKACRGDTLGDDYTAAAIRNALNHNQKAKSGEMEEEDRERYRQWGRMAGMSRTEIDTLCDTMPSATWQEKQRVWQLYKDLRDRYWEDYRYRRDRLQAEKDELYRMRRKIVDAEWVLNPHNRRRSIGGIILAAITLHRYGGSDFYNKCIEELMRQQEQLRAEASEFKKYSNNAVTVLKTRDLSLDTYLEAVQTMQNMAEDVCLSGAHSLEYWAKKYEHRYEMQLRRSVDLDTLLEASRKIADISASGVQKETELEKI